MSLNAFKHNNSGRNVSARCVARRAERIEALNLAQFAGIKVSLAQRAIHAAMELDLTDVPVKEYSQAELDQDATWEANDAREYEYDRLNGPDVWEDDDLSSFPDFSLWAEHELSEHIDAELVKYNTNVEIETFENDLDERYILEAL